MIAKPRSDANSFFLLLFVSASIRGFDLDQRCSPQLKTRWASRCRNIHETAQL